MPPEPQLEWFTATRFLIPCSLMVVAKLSQKVCRQASGKKDAVTPTAPPAIVNWLYWPRRLVAWLPGTGRLIHEAMGAWMRGSKQESSIALKGGRGGGAAARTRALRRADFSPPAALAAKKRPAGGMGAGQQGQKKICAGIGLYPMEMSGISIASSSPAARAASGPSAAVMPNDPGRAPRGKRRVTCPIFR